MAEKGSSSSSPQEYVPPSKYSITKSYGDMQNFIHSYGLKIYNPDDVDEANRIIEIFQEQNRKRSRESSKIRQVAI
jgi:hypothetical protein